MLSITFLAALNFLCGPVKVWYPQWMLATSFFDYVLPSF